MITGLDLVCVGVLFYILGIATKAFLVWYNKYNHPIDGLVFLDNGKERFVLTITHREAELKDQLIFQVVTQEDNAFYVQAKDEPQH